MRMLFRNKLLLLMSALFAAALSCFIICTEGTFVHDALPYILGVIGWVVIFYIFIIVSKNGGSEFEPYEREDKLNPA